jgi:predicted regulator of amino acid metabolism with ACT domain
MRYASLAAFTVLTCTATLYAESKPPTTAPAGDRAQSGVRITEKKLPELRFDNVGLSDVFDFLRDVTGASIFVNWKKIEAAGVDRNAPVSARLRDIEFQKALRVILDSVSEKAKLDFILDDGVITISTQDDLQSKVVTRVYDVRALDNWRKNAVPATRPTDAKDPLVGMITGTIDPTSWGKTGDVREVSGQLIVVATEENHKLVANLLDNLKRLAR